MPKTFYLTTAIAYVNSKPHMGHAMEFIEGDALLRYHRLLGDDTYGLTGTDEHGMKIVQTAKKAGIDTKEFVDQNAKLFQSLAATNVLNLSYDQFIRTSDQVRHWPGVVKMWEALKAAGDIYKGSYEGFYCVGCESFVAPNELIEGKCPIHGEVPQRLDEDNWFFRLSKYGPAIKEAIASGRLNIVPAFRANEILNVIGDGSGLRDVSFSRPRASLSWGVPVPGDPDQVMYVWCDALTNYISALGYGQDENAYQHYWANASERVHIIGKDILRFHAAIWPAMLTAAHVPLPTTLLVHGFVQMGGEKMSKSKGNVVNPLDLVAEWGTDALRWYLLREIPMGGDGDYTAERFAEVYQSELANTIGNLVQRVSTLVLKNNTTLVPIDDATKVLVREIFHAYEQQLTASYALHGACQQVMSLATRANQYVDQQKPWALAKTNPEKLPAVLSNLIGMIRTLSVLLYPIVPTTANAIRSRLGVSPITSEVQAPDWIPHEIVAGTESVRIQSGDPLFPRKTA